MIARVGSRVAWARLLTALVSGVVVAILIIGPAATAHATTAQEAVGLLSVQRQAAGIPPLSFSPYKTEGCDKHLTYLSMSPELSGLALHGEDPNRPGYSPQGAGIGVYGGAEVLAGSPPLVGEERWSVRRQPWLRAPLHAWILFAPSLTAAGYAEREGVSTRAAGACMRLGSDADPAVPQEPQTSFYSFPSGSFEAYPKWSPGAEDPYQPADLVDVPPNAGPPIYLYPPSLAQSILAATLTGPDGPVPVRWVDSSTPGHSYGHPIVFVMTPLRSLSSYSLQVRWHFAADGATPAREVVQEAPFRTGTRANPVAVIDADSRTISVNATYGGEKIAPGGELVLSGPAGATRRFGPGSPEWEDNGDGSGGFIVMLPYNAQLSAGSWRACATSGGAGTEFEVATGCKDFISSPRASTTTNPAPATVRKLGITIYRRAWRLRTFTRTGSASIGCRLTMAGVCSVRFEITAQTARSLRITAQKRSSRSLLAEGSRRVKANARLSITGRLSNRVRRGLRRVRRAVKVRVTVTGRSGGAVVVRRFSVRVRR